MCNNSLHVHVQCYYGNLFPLQKFVCTISFTEHLLLSVFGMSRMCIVGGCLVLQIHVQTCIIYMFVHV